MRRVFRPISRLHDQLALRRAFIFNVSWATLDTLFQGITTLVVAVVVARVLGPDALGFWTYAFAVYSLALIFATLGTEQIVVLDIVKSEQRARSVIATALAVRLGASIISAAAVFALSFAQPSGKADLASLLAVLALAIPAMSFDVTRLWFRAQSRFEIPAIANIATMLLGSAAKILLLLALGSLVYAGVAHVVQIVALQVTLLILLVTSYDKVAIADFDANYAKSLLRACLPLLASDLAILIYARANIFLLDSLRSPAEVGIFSAVSRISEAIYILPVVIGAVASPTMYRLYNDNRPLFLRRFDQILSGMTVTVLSLCGLIALFADDIISMLFGATFAQSVPVLVIHVWTAFFVAQGLVSNIWLLAEKATTIVLMRTLVGAVINICGGLLLIPHFGAAGAATATLVAMAFSSMIALLWAGPIGHEIFWCQLRSLVLMPLWRGMSK